MNRSFWLDTLFATAFIFTFMWGASKVLTSFDWLDPMGEALSDFEVTDLAFSQLRDSPMGDTSIVLVNIGDGRRGDIARQIEIISKYEPAVIGVDVFFYNPKPAEIEGDIALATAIAAAGNVVMVSKVAGYIDSLHAFDTLLTSHPMFRMGAMGTAHSNLITAASEQSDFKTCRTFNPTYMLDNGNTEPAFALKLASYIDSSAVNRLLARGEEVETINYRGNVFAPHSSNYPSMFFALDKDDVLQENFDPSLLKGKIVIFGYLGSNFFDRSWEDKLYTPMNKQYAGRTNPDMYGPVIHANITSMILRGDYINTMSNFWSIFIGVLLCWANVVLFSLIYHRIGRWYDGITKLIQILEAGILWVIIIYVAGNHSFKIELTLGITALLLAGDLLEVYNGVLKNLFSAEGRKQLFRVSKRKKMVSN